MKIKEAIVYVTAFDVVDKSFKKDEEYRKSSQGKPMEERAVYFLKGARDFGLAAYQWPATIVYRDSGIDFIVKTAKKAAAKRARK